MADFIIYISKKREPSDRFGIHWAKIELPDCDEEKATEKLDMMRILFGGGFVFSMIIRKRG